MGGISVNTRQTVNHQTDGQRQERQTAYRTFAAIHHFGNLYVSKFTQKNRVAKHLYTSLILVIWSSLAQMWRLPLMNPRSTTDVVCQILLTSVRRLRLCEAGYKVVFAMGRRLTRCQKWLDSLHDILTLSWLDALAAKVVYNIDFFFYFSMI